jgi:uncharacterized protein (DUF1697 family)
LAAAKPSKLIAFMRALNVGGHTVKMDALRALFGELGFAGVESFIASGNIIFDAPRGARPNGLAKLERRIEAHLEAALGYPVATFLRTPQALAEAAAYAPFEPAEVAQAHSVHLVLLSAPASAAAEARLAALNDAVNQFHCHGRELYWLRRAGQDVSPFSGAHLEKALGGPVTVRNLTTIRKLAAKYPPA